MRKEELQLDMILVRDALIGRRLKKSHSDGKERYNRLIIDIKKDYYGNAVFYFSKVYSNGAVLLEKDKLRKAVVMALIQNNNARDEYYIYELKSAPFEETIEKWRDLAEKKGLKLIIEKNNLSLFIVGINKETIDNVPENSVLHVARMALAMKGIKVDHIIREDFDCNVILDFDKIQIPPEAIIEEHECKKRRGENYSVFVVRIENLTNFKENTDYWREVRDKILFNLKGWENDRMDWGKGWVLQSLTDAKEVVRLIIQYGGKFIDQEEPLDDEDKWKKVPIPPEVIIEEKKYKNLKDKTFPVWLIRTENLKGIKKRSSEWRTILSLTSRQLYGWVNKNEDWGKGLILRSKADAELIVRAILKNGGEFVGM